MAIEERVLIAGAGPVGLVAAANLVRSGVPVTVLATSARSRARRPFTRRRSTCSIGSAPRSR